MNFILLEDSRYEVGSFIRKLYKRYPPSCRLSINKSNYNEARTLVNDSPILTDEWLVLLSSTLSTKQIGHIMNTDNINVLILQSKTKLDKIRDELKLQNIDFKIIDNLHPAKNEILLYVMESLNLSMSDATYLCNRHKFNLSKVINSVYILGTFDKVDRNIIKNYTDRFSSVSLYSVVDALLGFDTKHKNKVIELVYNYRYGIDFLLKFIQDKLEQYTLVFKYVSMGSLSLDNYLDFEPSEEDDRIYSKISEYELQKMINAYGQVSNSLLYFVTASIKDIQPKQSEIYKLVLLLL